MTGVFMCHCGNTGVERTPNKSQHTKLTLEKKILPPLLPGFELFAFRSRVRRSNQQVIPASLHNIALPKLHRTAPYCTLYTLYVGLLQYATLHCLHCTTLHCTVLHYTTPHYITLHSTRQHCVYYITRHFTGQRYTTLHSSPLDSTTCTTLHSTPQDSATLHYSPLH